MAQKLRVGVIYGGRSGEHEVSLRSARSVIEALDKDKYEVIPLGITRAGRWLAGATAKALLPPEAQKALPEDVEETASALATLNPTGAGAAQLDVVIPALHGTYGEDGAIQGMFEMAGVPYVAGFIAPNSTLGLVEIDAVKSSKDDDEIGSRSGSAKRG